MILYSIIPAEVVFSRQGDDISDAGQREIQYMGERVQVSALTNNRYVIQRLLSTNPVSYLNPKLQPGTIIELKI